MQVAAQIDQGVSATDEIEFGERRIFDDVLLGKDQHVADTFVYPVSAAGRIYKKKRARRSIEKSVVTLA